MIASNFARTLELRHKTFLTLNLSIVLFSLFKIIARFYSGVLCLATSDIIALNYFDSGYELALNFF